MSAKNPSGIMEGVRIIALSLSFIFLFNQAFAEGASLAQYKIEMENRLLEGVGKWNQSRDYNHIISQMNATPAEKAYLKSLFKKNGQGREKPFIVEFHPPKHQFKLHFKNRTESLWLLSMAPTFMFYDGKTVTEFKPKTAVGDYLPGFKTNKKKTKFQKTSGLFWSIMLPFSFAGGLLDAPAEGFKDAGTQLKNLFMIGIVSFVGFLGTLWGYSHLGSIFGDDSKSDSDSGSDSGTDSIGEAGSSNTNNDQKSRDIALADYPDIDKGLIDPSEPITFIQCEKDMENSPLKKITFRSKDNKNVDFDFGSGKDQLDSFKDPAKPFAKKIQLAQECCQKFPCISMLSNRLTHQDLTSPPQDQRPITEQNK